MCQARREPCGRRCRGPSPAGLLTVELSVGGLGPGLSGQLGDGRSAVDPDVLPRDDDPVPVAKRPATDRIRAEPDLRRAVALLDQRLTGARLWVEALTSKAPLRPGLDPQQRGGRAVVL